MKELFTDAIRTGQVTTPRFWGWGNKGESRPLPIMPEWCPFVAEFRSLVAVAPCLRWQVDGLDSAFVNEPLYGMTYAEMSHHVGELDTVSPTRVGCSVCSSITCLTASLDSFVKSRNLAWAWAVLSDFHWSPVLVWKQSDRMVVVTEDAIVKAFPM